MSDENTKLLEKLVEASVLDHEGARKVLHYQKMHGTTIEDAAIDSGIITEEVLLKTMAHLYRTRFVATEKLKRAEISRNVLDRVPAKLAEKYTVCPILYDKNNNELSLVTADPSNLVVEQEIAHASGIPRIRLFMARPAAVKAAVSKFYRGDIHAFNALDKAGYAAFHSMMDVYERNLLDAETMATSLAAENSPREQMFSAKDIHQKAAASEQDTPKVGGQDLGSTLEMLRIMVSLLDSTRGELAGHSVQTSRLIERMGNRIGLAKRDLSALEMAGLLHDLGKGSPYHLTPLNAAEWEGHRTAAEKRYENPEQLFSSVMLPEGTVKALHHMYERFDGQGFPEKLRGKDIPLGARILAMADTFSDLTSNPRNPFRRILTTEQAMQILVKAKEKVFDPDLVDLFGFVVAGDDLKRKLLTGAQAVLLVDPDPEQSAILDLQLTSRGFRVRCAYSVDAALKIIEEQKPSIIVSEVVFDVADGFELKRKLNQSEATQSIPLVFYSSRAASADVQTGFGLGAKDYLVKPSSVDIVAAKIQKILDERPGRESGGVSGSLTEMSLPDLVQILAHGRKTGQLKLRMGPHQGEIHFVTGEIYNALFEKLRGEEAFFQMLKFKDGTFSLNPGFTSDTKVINMSAEMLLLEGMRRMDEENR
jgi:response regulator RpfG family c-di-GMP phosphodiesterase